MDILLIIIMLAFFAFGFVAMGKFDKFIASPNFLPDLKETGSIENKTERVLIFGRPLLSSEIAILLDRQNVAYTLIEDTNELDKSQAYKYLFAVDESDLENLMICSITERMMGITKRIAICNCLDNRRIFEDNHIPYLYGNNVSAPKLASTLLSSLLKAGGESDV